MNSAETLQWWRGVGYGLGLALIVVLINEGAGRWKDAPEQSHFLENVVLIIGLQMLVQGIEYRFLEKRSVGNVFLALGVALLCQGLL